MNAKNTKGDNLSQDAQQFDSQFGASSFGGPAAGSQFGGGANNGAGFSQGGEFGASQFGGTNAVSQMFPGSQYNDGEKKKKVMLLGGLAIAVLAVGGYIAYTILMPGDEAPPPEAAAPVAPPVAPPKPAAAPANKAPGATTASGPDAKGAGLTPMTADAGKGATDADDVEGDDDAKGAGAPASGSASADTTYTYNELKGGPVVSANDGAMIEVSRNQNFASRYVIGPVKNGSFRIPNPPPGTVYWREQGSQDVKSIQVNAAPTLSLSFSAPASLAAGDQLSWSASGKAGFYRVEFAADKSFSSVSNIYSTVQKSVAVKDLPGGTYFVRLGGFNLASGRWEFSDASSVTVK